MSFRPPVPRAKPAKDSKPLRRPQPGPVLSAKTAPKAAPAKPCK